MSEHTRHLQLVRSTEVPAPQVFNDSEALITEAPGGVPLPEAHLSVVPDLITAEDVPKAPEISAAQHVIEELASPEGYEAYIGALKEVLADHDMQGIDRLMRGKEKMIDEAARLVNEDGRKLKEYDRIKAVAGQNVATARRMYGADKVTRYEQIQRELNASRHGRLCISGEAANTLLTDILQGATNEYYETMDKPHAFVQPESLAHAKHKGSIEVATTFYHAPIDIPISMIVSAVGMSDWQGTGGWPEKVKKFTDLPAETLPPIVDLYGYILPDGRVYFESGNAHRACAAVNRGDTSIRFGGEVDFRVLSEIPKELEV